MLNALILLGGLGSRLRPLTLSQPKPLLPILNRPFIAYQIDLLRKFGVRRVVLALGHKAAHFKRHLGTGKNFGVEFIYSFEKEPLGTGGAIRHALPHLNGAAIIFNGDVLSDFNIGEMLTRHKKRKADATLALVEVSDPSAFGLVETDAHGRIQRFLEKPSGDTFPVRTINAGCYLFEPWVVESIPANRPVSLERETFPALLSGKYNVDSFLHVGYWSDIGSLRTYWSTHLDLHQREHWPPGVHHKKGFILASDTHVDKSVQVRGTVLLGHKTWVGPSVSFVGSVTLGDRVRIEEGAYIEDSVILKGARIGPRSRVERSIVGAGGMIGADCRVGPDQVLGDRARLPDYSQVFPGVFTNE